jgi:hypothetical protein
VQVAGDAFTVLEDDEHLALLLGQGPLEREGRLGGEATEHGQVFPRVADGRGADHDQQPMERVRRGQRDHRRRTVRQGHRPRRRLPDAFDDNLLP